MYKVKILKQAEKELQKMDKQNALMIKNYIIKKLVDTDNPRIHGKALTGNLKGVWRYRVGDYRLFAEIKEDIVTIFIIDIGHRKDVYNKK